MADETDDDDRARRELAADHPRPGAAQRPSGRHRRQRSTNRGDVTTAQRAHRRRWAGLAVLLIAGFMDLMDVTIVYVAIPSIQHDLSATYLDMEWIVSGYVLGFAALLLIGAQLGDRVGRRQVLLIGLAGFTAASLTCGIAANAAVLITARWIQGAMAGLMIPQVLAIIQVTFAPKDRTKALAIWGAVLGGASVTGVILGGVLVQYDLLGWEWRPIFLVNVPIGLLVIPAAAYLVSESRSPTPIRLDLVGMLLACGAVLLLIYPLTVGHSLAWPPWTFLMMATALLVAAILVVHQRHRTHHGRSALITVGLFTVRTFSLGITVWGLFWVVSGGFFLIWTLYLQIGLGWTPLHAGLTAATFSIGAAAAAGLSMEVLVPRYGRRVLTAGALINAAGFGTYLWAATHYGPTITSTQMIIPLLVTGVGFGLLVAPMVDLILTDVPTPDAGSASGLLSTTQQIGMAVGVALAATAFFTHLTHTTQAALHAVTPVLQQRLTTAGITGPTQQHLIAEFAHCVADRGRVPDPATTPPSCHLPSPADHNGALHDVLTNAAHDAQAYTLTHAFTTTLGYGTALLLLIWIGTYGLPPHLRPTTADPTTRS